MEDEQLTFLKIAGLALLRRCVVERYMALEAHALAQLARALALGANGMRDVRNLLMRGTNNEHLTRPAPARRLRAPHHTIPKPAGLGFALRANRPSGDPVEFDLTLYLQSIIESLNIHAVPGLFGVRYDRKIAMDEAFQAILDSLPPKAARSKLEPYAELIRELRKRGRSYREIASILGERCGVTVGIHTVYNFVQVRSKAKGKTSPGELAGSSSGPQPRAPARRNRTTRTRRDARSKR